MPEVSKMSEARQELYELVQEIHESEIERVLKVVRAITETTAYERKKWWEENVDSNEQCEEDLTEESRAQLEESRRRLQNGEGAAWEELCEKMGYNTDGSTKL